MMQDTASPTVDKRPVILHLSDLHFGWDGDVRRQEERTLTLKGLGETVMNLDTDWRPNCICISGDIGWQGEAGDYELARKWLLSFIGALQLSADALILCPGNHDASRPSARRYPRPSNPTEADDVLGTDPLPALYEEPFTAFSAFCGEMRVPLMRVGSRDSYLVGSRCFLGVRFVALNSAWFAKDDSDRANLWVGLPLLRRMEASKQLPAPREVFEPPLTVALIHHPREWLAEDEIRVAGARPNTHDFLALRTDLILTGHTHGEVRAADLCSERAWVLSGGAAYAGASHFNSFRLIRFEGDRLVYRAFEFDPRTPSQVWCPKTGPISLPLGGPQSAQPTPAYPCDEGLLSKLRNACRKDAMRLVERKSRQIKPFGILPDPIDRDVAVRVTQEQDRYDAQRRLIFPKESLVPIPLYDATRRERRCLLLGDLGTGKSTLAGMLVAKILAAETRSLAAVVPAKSLALSSSSTVRELLHAASQYVSGQVAPDVEGMSLEVAIKGGVEVTLVIDGLDEVPKATAAVLLRQVWALTDQWPNIQVLATGRPVELLGVGYEQWRLLQTLPLADEEKRRIFEAEVRAEGKDEAEAQDLAEKAMGALRRFPALNALTGTPLAARLAFQKMPALDGAAERLSLGDLLAELLYERLGRWSRRDTKETTTPLLEERLPTPDARAALLGQLCVRAIDGNIKTREHALFVLRGSVGSNEHALAEQALESFEQAGLVVFDEGLSFPVQPLFEVAAGYGLVEFWRGNETEPMAPAPARWRIVSFAATMARRLGLVADLKARFSEFVGVLLRDPTGIPPACYVVTELQDSDFAIETLGRCKDLGPRPLTLLWEEEFASARAVAETIYMAGDEGFDWFYAEYLDPRYPTRHYASAVNSAIFRQWASLSRNGVTVHQQRLLELLVRPHVAAGTGRVIDIIPALAILVPNAFAAEERTWFQSSFLGEGILSKVAEEVLRTAHRAGSHNIVNAVLIERAKSSPFAAGLWMQLNPGAPPPMQIVKGLIRANRAEYPCKSAESATGDCIRRIGEDSWAAVLRWCLSEGDAALAGCAALELMRRGIEDRFELLRAALLGSLRGVRAAERALRETVKEAGQRGIRWLGGVVASTEGEHLGAPEGCWRVFLEGLQDLKGEGPRLLAKSVGAIGPFLLQRHPEVREGLNRLLKGPSGPSYCSALRKQLGHWDPTVRYGAAMVLVVCDPSADAQALDVLVRGRPGKGFGSWHEWEAYLLSLRFGPTVLAHIESGLNSYSARSRALALAILARHEMPLTAELRRDLIVSLLDTENWWLDGREKDTSLLARSEALPVLRSAAERVVGHSAISAAEALLKFHRGALSPIQEAKYELLVLARPHGSLGAIQGMLGRMREDECYAQTIEEAAKQIEEQGAPAPLLEVVRRAISTPSEWKSVVWELSQGSLGGLGYEDNGQLLLDIGRIDREWGRAIGRACQELLQDPRVRQLRFKEAIHWIALLGHEFGAISAGDLEGALSAGHSIARATEQAIIARLGRVPSQVHTRDRIGLPPAGLGKPTRVRPTHEVTTGKLKEFARPSENLHPELHQTIEDALLETPLKDDYLDELGKGGVPGALVSSCLRFCYGRRLGMRESLQLFRFWPDTVQRQDRLMMRLYRCWREHCTADIRTHPDTKRQFLEELDALLLRDTYSACDVAAQLLVLRGRLLPAQIGRVFEFCAENPWSLNTEMGKLFVDWLSGDLDAETAEAVDAACTRALGVLDETSWEPTSQEHLREIIAFLLFPSVYWACTGKESDRAGRVFLRGLKFLAGHAGGGQAVIARLADMLKTLEPLLAKVRPSLIEGLLHQGRQSDDLALRAICRLFSLR